MQPLPPDFLIEIARQHNLSLEQEEAFVERFRIKQNEQAVAESLHISTNALRSRMSGVYTKFSIGGKGPGKLRQLHDLLLQKYRKANPSDISTPNSAGDIDTLVQEVRQKVHDDIQARCGKMRVLDMTHPIGLKDIYTSVNILEKITGHRRLEIEELLQDCDLENFDRLGLGSILQKRASGLEAVEQHSKLMILGKPGAGKTTFLKRLATLCNLGEFQAGCVSIFITLKDFAEAKGQPGLLAYITQQWSDCGFRDTAIADILLSQGRGLVLLDGLDEVRETDHDRVLQEIRNFTTQFRTCQFVMTCRIAAQEYTFEQFTEVEVADFNDEQIAEFAKKWFQAKEDSVKSETFIQKLKDNKPIQELATNPLLLTLLCLVFGEAADFPRNRSELYKEGLDVLLKKWDSKRNIERDKVYKQLSLKRKEDLLSHLALDMFGRGDYFFKQKTVEAQITLYIQNLPDAKTDPDALQLDSEVVLKSIEAQHGLLVERARGIYSFSHLTFQEYFTAKRIADRPLIQGLEALQYLASHIANKRWREIFLLTVGMLSDADCLLEQMKVQADSLLAGDNQLQHFLIWVDKKSVSVEASYKPAAVRAFYLTRAINRARALNLNRDLNRTRTRAINRTRARTRARAINININRTRTRVRTLDFDLDLDLDRVLDRVLSRDCAYTLARVLDRVLDRASEPKLKQALDSLKNQLPDRKVDREAFKQWWLSNSETWAEDLRAVMIKHRNIGHDWQFSDEQKKKLKQYYDANKLLVDCLNSDCYVTRAVREEIEDTLLLPIAEIERRKREQR